MAGPVIRVTLQRCRRPVLRRVGRSHPLLRCVGRWIFVPRYPSSNLAHVTINHAFAALVRHSLPKASESISAGAESLAAILPHQRW